MNININNYLSKQNINQISDSSNNYTNSIANNPKTKKPKIFLKKNNSAKIKGYLLQNSYNNLNINYKIRNLKNLNIVFIQILSIFIKYDNFFISINNL